MARARTSSVIRGGNFEGRVVAEDAVGKTVEIAYDINIVIQGHQTGVEKIPIDALYFSPEFMVDLRERGAHATDKFKIKHLGYGDATNLDGQVYPHCDKIMIYDVQVDEGFWADTFLRAAAEVRGRSLGIEIEQLPIQDLVIHAMVNPASGKGSLLGLVKLDLAGKYTGIAVKLGVDYLPAPTKLH
jgi:hypothetical protein